MSTGDVQIEQPVGYLGTGKGTIEVLLGHSPSYYRLHADRDDFDAQLACSCRPGRTARLSARRSAGRRSSRSSRPAEGGTVGSAVTPRGTDWGLALLVAIAVGTGLATWFAGSPGAAWVFGAHAAGGTVIAFVLVYKLRRVLPRLLARRDRRSAAGVAALTLVTAALGSGYVWSSGGSLSLAGFTLLAWHAALGGVLALGVLCTRCCAPSRCAGAMPATGASS